MTDTKPKGRLLYRSDDKDTGDVKFCYAANAAQARNRVTRDRFSIRLARPEDTFGVKPEEVLDATLP